MVVGTFGRAAATPVGVGVTDGRGDPGEAIPFGRTWQACDPSGAIPAGAGRGRGTRRAAFLDRDGTLIVDKPYNADPNAIEVLPGVPEGLRLLAEAGYLLVVVTNQSGVARGRYDGAAVARMHDRLNEVFAPAGVRVAAYYYCPHHVDGVVPCLAVACPSRKPGPGMFLRAARDWSIDLRRSWMFGDQATDVLAARAARCRGLLVASEGAARGFRGTRAGGLLEAARHVIALDERARSVFAGGLRLALPA